jgi:hypothetical protein
MSRRALARRYGRARTAEGENMGWLEHSHEWWAWWARAEHKAPVELLAYRRARASGSTKRADAALEKLKETMS